MFRIITCIGGWNKLEILSGIRYSIEQDTQWNKISSEIICIVE